jgi:hypothetical protein
MYVQIVFKIVFTSRSKPCTCVLRGPFLSLSSLQNFVFRGNLKLNPAEVDKLLNYVTLARKGHFQIMYIHMLMRNLF